MVKSPKLSKDQTYTKLLEISGILLIIIIWILASNFIKEINPERGGKILPSPKQVIESFSEFSTYSLEAQGQKSFKIASKVIIKHSLISISRLLAGTVLGIIFGVLVGLLLGTYKILNELISPVLLMLRTIPILAIIPLFLVWFAGNELGNILYITFAVFCMIVINTIEAIKNVPVIYYKNALTLGANKKAIFLKITLPSIIPELIGGVRVVIGLSWAIVLAAEYLAAEEGIGYMLIASERYMYTSKMLLIIILIMIYATLLNFLIIKLSNHITRWKPRI